MIFSLLCLIFTWEHKAMNLNVFILGLIIIKSTRCSVVHEELNQESIHMSKYCPKQKYCGEGSHVVCMYYDQYHEFGARCSDPVKIQMTDKMIQNILANVNDIRSKVATGTEKGMDDEVLPRAYGLMKLEWDKELAFLAKVLANQCLGGREDNCRSTDRFPNPSQTIAVIRYKYPYWEYLQPNNTEKGLNEGKLLFALDKFLKTTHELKRTVTKDIIMKCPAYHELPNVNLKYYLNLIRGGATHIGCGVSAYSKYKMDGDTESMQNNVQIVCNISDAPKIKQAVYKVVPPASGQGYSKRCGCPRGYKESRSCLCERDLKYQWKGKKQTEDNIEKKKKGIKHELLDEYEKHTNKDVKYRQHEIDNEADVDNDIMEFNEQSNHLIIHDSQENKDNHPNEIESAHNTPKSHNEIKLNDKHRQTETKGAKFKFSDEVARITNAIKPKNKNYKNTRFHKERVMMFTSNHESEDQARKPKPAKPADAFEEIIMNVKPYGRKETKESAKDSIHHQHITKKADVKPQNNERDSKHKRLLSLLNSLEQEVINIKFDNDLQKLFDLKMRKIYAKGLKKAKETPPLRTFDKQLDEEDLLELRTYLENDNNASVEDEIATLRRMIHQLSKGKQEGRIVNYAENENNPDQYYNYMDQQIDKFHNIKNIATLDEDILRKTALADHRDNRVQFLDIMNRRQNNVHEHPKTRNQEPLLANNIIPQNIVLRADDNLNNYDENNYERHGGLHETLKRTFDTRLQFSQPFSRGIENDDLHQTLLQRPNLLGTLKFYRNQQRPPIYPSGRDRIITY